MRQNHEHEAHCAKRTSRMHRTLSDLICCTCDQESEAEALADVSIAHRARVQQPQQPRKVTRTRAAMCAAINVALTLFFLLLFIGIAETAMQFFDNAVAVPLIVIAALAWLFISEYREQRNGGKE